MSTTQNQPKTPQEEEEEEAALMSALRLSTASGISMVLKAAIELGVLEIIAGSAGLTPAEIAAHLPATNPEAPAVLDRILRFLASHSVLTQAPAAADNGGRTGWRYGPAPVCRFLTRNRDGASLAAMALMTPDPVLLDSWQHLKYAVLDGVTPFTKAHGMSAFEYAGTNSRFNQLFNECMADTSTLILKKLLESYDGGLASLRELIDVGGGTGAALDMIVTKYPHIRGINFDLPHVISDAPPIPGVEHVGGDMFVGIPSGETIFMKSILHDWSDEQCLRILKNCWEALPRAGKVIVVDGLLPETPETDFAAEIFYLDLCMLVCNPGGKERSESEFRSLAMAAGFSGFKVVGPVYHIWVMEFNK